MFTESHEKTLFLKYLYFFHWNVINEENILCAEVQPAILKYVMLT